MSGPEPQPVRTPPRRGHRLGQAMVETALAVLFVTVAFLMLFQLAHAVTARILLGHAAARAARARAVGFNDWMCLKSARVAMIPVAGAMTWPEDGVSDEASRVPAYMQAENVSRANGILEYAGWGSMDFHVESGIVGEEVDARVSLGVPRFYSRGGDGSGSFKVTGEASVEAHYPLYMFNQGL